MESESELTVRALFEEYASLKSESRLQIELLNRQAQHIQVFFAVVAGLLAATSFFLRTSDGGPNYWFSGAIASGDRFVALLVILLAWATVLFLVANSMSASMMLLVLRRRMGWIESHINQRVAGDRQEVVSVLSYESKIAKSLLEQKRIDGGQFLPHCLSGISRYAMLLLLLVLLGFLALRILRGMLGVATATIMLLSGLFVGVQWSMLYSESGLSRIQRLVDGESPPDHPPRAWLKQLRRLIPPSIFLGVLVYAAVEPTIPQGLEDLRGFLQRALQSGIGGQESFYWYLLIFLYTVLAATLVPLPVELPIVLIGQAGALGVLGSAALGRVAGALGLFWVSPRVGTLLGGLLRRELRIVRNRTSIWPVYALMQGVPFLPLRLSTLALGASLSRTLRNCGVVAAIVFIASFTRMLLVWVLLQFGVAAIAVAGNAERF